MASVSVSVLPLTLRILIKFVKNALLFVKNAKLKKMIVLHVEKTHMSNQN
jgi:hypothetical protein